MDFFFLYKFGQIIAIFYIHTLQIIYKAYLNLRTGDELYPVKIHDLLSLLYSRFIH